MQKWGINVMADYVKDLEDSPNKGLDIQVQNFGKHPIVAPLAQRSLHMVLPRPVAKMIWQNPPANAPAVEELAFSGPTSTLGIDKAEPPRAYSLMVAAEQKSVAGVANPRGSTRIVAAGDSISWATIILRMWRTGIFWTRPSTGCWTGTSWCRALPRKR